MQQDEDWGPWMTRGALPPENVATRVKLFDRETHTFLRVEYGRRVGNAFWAHGEEPGGAIDYSVYVGAFSIRTPRALAELRALIADVRVDA